MLFFTESLSETEKIDRIYTMLRAERRARFFARILKISLLGIIIFGYYYLTLPANEDIRKNITETVQIRITEFISPMVSWMVQSLTQDMWIPTATINKKNIPAGSTDLPAGITPEMIKLYLNAIKK